MSTHDQKLLQQEKLILKLVNKLAKEYGGSVRLTMADKIDWAYGNAVIENPEVTREMVEEAAKELYSERGEDEE